MHRMWREDEGVCVCVFWGRRGRHVGSCSGDLLCTKEEAVRVLI